MSVRKVFELIRGVFLRRSLGQRMVWRERRGNNRLAPAARAWADPRSLRLLCCEEVVAWLLAGEVLLVVGVYM